MASDPPVITICEICGCATGGGSFCYEHVPYMVYPQKDGTFLVDRNGRKHISFDDPPASSSPQTAQDTYRGGAPMPQYAVLGIGAEAWVELTMEEQRAVVQKVAPRAGVTVSWRTFQTVMNVLRAIRLKDFQSSSVRSTPEAKSAAAIPARTSLRDSGSGSATGDAASSVPNGADSGQPSSSPPPDARGWQPIEMHGVDCPKAFHDWRQTGYLHSDDDDQPYDVDGVLYCGRCHAALPPPPGSGSAEK